jgi:sorbose reductase
MVEQKTGGSILFVASMSGHIVLFPQPQAAYGASKAAVLHLTRSLAAEWAIHGIRVNSISPGYMDTVLNEGEGLNNARRIWMEHCPMGRMGKPSELMGAVVMLSSSAGGYITGADLMIDGEYCSEFFMDTTNKFLGGSSLT